METFSIILALSVCVLVWYSASKKWKAKGYGFFIRNVAASTLGTVAMIATVAAMMAVGLVPSGTSQAEGVAGVEYRKTQDEALGTIKRTVEVRIDAPVDEATLEKLAHQIQSERATKYERTFIGWRLAGELAGPYWATTHFNPTLEVKILGATPTQ